MESKQFGFVALFAIVTVVGFVMMFMATVTPADTGMVPRLAPSIRPQIDLNGLRYGVCMKQCETRFKTCLQEVHDDWMNCMSHAATDVCGFENPAPCYKTRSLCESRCKKAYPPLL